MVAFFNSAIYDNADFRTGTRSLLSLVYNASESDRDEPHVVYSPVPQNTGPHSPTVFSNEEVKSRLRQYQIPDSESFVPGRMEVRERSTLRERGDSRRLVLLRDDKMHYKVFKFGDRTTIRDGDTPMS